MKAPDQATGPDIVGANVAGTRFIFFVGGRAQDQEIFKHAPGSGRLNQGQAFRIASQALLANRRGHRLPKSTID